MTVSRDRKPDRGPDGDRGATRERILQLWRETAMPMYMQRHTRVVAPQYGTMFTVDSQSTHGGAVAS